MTDVVIASAARTAIGSYGKGLASIPPADLGALASSAAIERAGIEPAAVEHAVFGNVIHTDPGDADRELGLVTLCIGGGQGIALLLGRE
jgi:acetyl-CoA C-acetyltransferase